ncbi:hypothetical protein ILYODFUR_018921, partial [Ilyodon furcidens]
VLQQQCAFCSLLLPGQELHSSPLRSIHTQGNGRTESTAATPCDQRGNEPKLWNLKPWRGYQPSGSLERECGCSG